MASQVRNHAELGKTLYRFREPNRWQKGLGVYLPKEYKKFFNEWKLKKPQPIHYIPREGRYYRDEKSGLIQPVQNVPIPLKFPKEFDECLLGGEGLIQGFTKKANYNRRVPRFWFPRLMSSVVYSQVLDLYLKVIVTPRALELIHSNYGLDHYILKTSACDIRSLIGIKLKRNILLALSNKTLYPDDPVKREEIYETYKKYLDSYTEKEIEWYGLTYKEASLKLKAEMEANNVIEPLKIGFRKNVIDQLKATTEANEELEEEKSLLTKIKELNPFIKD
ncbi:39S ribosomal protein L28, mitochondrial [Leptopilina heterotoma]|uniref:39S ribosomal protein L28, mitochondrial n=1 Tax=Leptopilina heterotoma TaxID=63436 RepID=UPI001CA9CCA2|nr:39S ribosomal protein L28, mitochondrial [Leptopilina heterotoma]